MTNKYQENKNSENNEIRYDLELVMDLVKEGSKVLDVGCSDGSLLELLTKQKKCDARGIEISSHLVNKALMKGLSVIQADAEKDLIHYPDNTFDYAILSHTIQATQRPDHVIQEMLRIADLVIVSLPNFANYKNRFQLLFNGTMPVNEAIPYQWYETPNIHFRSIKDFKNLCHKMEIDIIAERYIVNNIAIKNNIFVNLLADYGIFLIKANKYAGITESEPVDKVDKKNVNFQPI